MERVNGIEPSYAAWEAAVLPLNYTRVVECGADSNTDNMHTVITVSINGEPRQLPTNISVATLVEEMGLTGKRIALERNGEIVPRSTFPTQLLSDNDRLEIVVAVGGG